MPVAMAACASVWLNPPLNMTTQLSSSALLPARPSTSMYRACTNCSCGVSEVKAWPVTAL